MSAYVGHQVRVVHGYWDRAGNRIHAGSVGMCIADHSTLLSVELPGGRVVRLAHAFVDIMSTDVDEVVWVNE